MKKIIVGIFVFALLASTAVYAERGSRDGRDDDTATSTKSEIRKEMRNKKNKNGTSTVDISCVSLAVSTREDAIMKAWTSFNTEVTSTLTERKAGLVTAWGLTDAKERRAEIKKIWDSSKKDKKAAGAEFKKTKRAAWDEFKKASKACGGSVGSDASGESEAGDEFEI